MNAGEWAERLIAGIESQVRNALSRDPKGTITAHFQLTLQPTATRPSRGDGGTCDGLSIVDEGKILYVPTPGWKRENFTLLHELAHHLVAKFRALLSWAADQENPKRAIEEVCDRFAAGLLVPNDLVDRALVGASPAAAHLLALYRSSSGSREVCAIALARRLPCEGLVVVIDMNEMKVSFGTRTVDTRPYAWRGDEVPPLHPLYDLGPNSPKRCESWWPFPDGEKRELYMDAVSDDKYIYVVFAARDLWNTVKFHALTPVDDKPTGLSLSVTCPFCGYKGPTRGYPCSVCRKPSCPKCHKCHCDLAARQSAPCKQCHIIVPRRTLVDGVCKECGSKRRPTRS